MKVTSSLRRSDPQQSNELPVGRSALIFLKGFVFEPLDADLDYFWLADDTPAAPTFRHRDYISACLKLSDMHASRPRSPVNETSPRHE
jgi:hypothetical protein